MIVKTESLGGCKILRVSGRIDFESALDFEHEINAMIQEGGDCYIIELSQVELLSSAGLRVLLSTAKRVAHRNASLALAAPSQVVCQVFEISHFNLLFKSFPSVPAAIAALKGITEVMPPEESAQAALSPSRLSPRMEAKSTDLFVSSAQPIAKGPRPQKEEATQPGPLTAISQPSSVPGVAETPTVMPLPLPMEGSTKAPAAAVVPNRPSEGPGEQTSPSIPSANQSAHVSPASVESATTRAAGPLTRREAKYPSSLEVRAEGASYPCKDGDVIGTEGRLAQPFFSQIPNLAPRHLLIGELEGRWFVFTPKNVQHPFVLDGVVLRAGERKTLQYVEHQLEFNGRVFGFRLVPQQQKEGFLSRIFGRKR
jgi:anti-sigma B factor antagonist